MFKKTLTSILAVMMMTAVSSLSHAIQGVPWNQTLTPYDDPSGPEHMSCEYFHWRAPRCPEKVAPANVVLDGVNFDFDKATLRPESYSILDGNVARLKGNSKNVTIEGHTDSIGSDTYNQSLSERRANTVKEYFISKGIEGSRLSAVGKGESSPISDNSTAEGRFKNRRVELKVH